MPIVVTKETGFWVIVNDESGDKVFYLYELNRPNRQTVEIVRRSRHGNRITKMEVSYFHFYVCFLTLKFSKTNHIFH